MCDYCDLACAIRSLAMITSKVFRAEGSRTQLKMESFGLSLAFILCTLLTVAMLWTSLPLAWKLFTSPHWMVRIVVYVEDHQPARHDSDESKRTNRLQLRTCPLPLLLRSLPLNNTVSRLTANFEETLT